MKAFDVKNYLGKCCDVTYLNKQGDLTLRKLKLQEIVYVPLYGRYLIGDTADICLDRVQHIVISP